MIAPTTPLPIEVENPDFPVSDEAVDLVASLLLDAVDRRDRKAAAEESETHRRP